MSPAAGLSDFQREVARTFFSQADSRGFFVVGGAALIAQRLVSRETQDLDLFTHTAAGGTVASARDALVSAAAERRWNVELLRDAETFCRLLVDNVDEAVLVDLALDAPPMFDPIESPLGPTLHPLDLAARKVLALYDRAEARDFTDVFALAGKHGTATLLRLAAEADAGFDLSVFARALSFLGRFDDADLPAGVDARGLRTFYAEWGDELARGAPGGADTSE